MTVGDRLEKLAWWFDRRPILIVALLAAVYVALIAPSIHRHLWYDELHTVYIAQASSVRQFIDEVRLLDLNPPLTYLLVRASMGVLGPTELGARLPSMIGYFLGSIGMFVFIARRVGAWWGAAGVGLFWYNQFFYFAAEARPYGVLLGCLGLTLVSWDYATRGAPTRSERGWAIAGVALGATGMLLTHVYAVLWMMPFWVAELVRNWRQRRIDWLLWAALLLPLVSCLTYFPLIQNVAQAVFPPVYDGSIARAIQFYMKIFFQVSPALVAGSLVAFAIAVWRRHSRAAEPRSSATEMSRHLEAHELAFLLASLLPPAVVDAVSVYKHIAFYDRHAILTVLTMNLLLLLFIAYETQANRPSGMAAAFVILGLNLFLPGLALAQLTPQAKASETALRKDIEWIHTELPLVANSALTFLEVDHYEKPEFLARFYYLVDQEASVKYSQTNLTEGLLLIKQYFPIRAHVFSYSEFTERNRHFLVWGSFDHPGWLLRKLKAEGAQVNEIGQFATSFPDSQLYEVRLDP